VAYSINHKITFTGASFSGYFLVGHGVHIGFLMVIWFDS